MSKTVLALGYFDSVHNGHRHLLKIAKDYAIEHNATLTVFTFGGNLKGVLNNNGDKCVYSAKEREVLLNSCGADVIYFAPVDKPFLSLTKGEFLDHLNSKFNVICYVCGEDYSFGQFGAGKSEDIRTYAQNNGQELIVVPPVLDGEKKISTTLIKDFLSLGDVKKAGSLLGQSYSVTGVVHADRQVGHKLGFPTANISIDSDKFALKNGVYKGRVTVDGKSYKTIINYGARPTFNLDEKLIETHVIDYDGDLYGKEITLFFDAYMREILKFSSPEQLKEQLQKDVESVKGGKYD